MRQSYGLGQHWLPSTCRSSSPIKKVGALGLANPRIAMVLVIPKHNAPFHPGAHWLPISQPRNREIRKFEYRFVFIVVLYVSIDVDIGHLPSLTLDLMIVRINAVQRIE